MKTAAVLAALIVLGWATFGFSQATTRPTTQAATPATMPSVKDAQATLDSAALALKQAQAVAELRLQTIPTYQKLLAAVDAASAKRDAVKESDAASPQDKVDAASAVGTAKKAADDFKSKYIANDPGVITATNAVTAATANLKAAQANAVAEKLQAADAAVPQKIKDAIAKHQLCEGMTLEQANQAMGSTGRITSHDTNLDWYAWDKPGFSDIQAAVANGKIIEFGMHLSN